MSSAPKFAVFGKSVPSRRAKASSVRLPKVRTGRPDAAPWESATDIAASAPTLRQEFGERRPEVETRLLGARNAQRKPANSRERRARFAEREAWRSLQPPQRDRQTTHLVSQSASLPVWLTWLIQWQRRSSLVTFLLVSATLAVYGGTVYTQQLWNREYRQLETLQLQQRQLTAASEVLKNRLAEEAEQQNNGLVPATPNTNLFLPPAQEQPNQLPSGAPALNRSANSQLLPKPVGY